MRIEITKFYMRIHGLKENLNLINHIANEANINKMKFEFNYEKDYAEVWDTRYKLYTALIEILYLTEDIKIEIGGM